jgi:hypothetical protein
MGMKECSLRNTDHGRFERDAKIGVPEHRPSLTLGESEFLKIDPERNDMPHPLSQVGFRIAEEDWPEMTPSPRPKGIHQDGFEAILC